MKTIYISLIILLCGMLQTGCMNENVPAELVGTGNGTFTLSLLTEDVQTETITRNGVTVDESTFKVTLKDSKGITLIDAKPYSELSVADRTLPAGTGYQMTVESCTEAEATTANDGWGAMRFTGNATFEIISDKSTDLTINCDMENAGLQLIFAESFITKFPTYAATTQDDRQLVFKGSNTEAIAYYDVVAGVTNPSVAIRLTGSAGGWSDRLEYTQEIALTKGKITRLTAIYDENSGDIDIDFDTDTDMENGDDSDVTIQ